MELLKIKNRSSFILKFAIFSTGFAGIVAEYILSTLATYFLGDSVFQFTMIVSLMLFFMGIGSRLSRFIKGNLITHFLLLEVALSILVSFSSIFIYSLSAVTIYYGFWIYTLSISIGLLIGLEIPLVIRINKEYEELKTNISSILEKDYYGSLFGGVFFAFIGLPIIGLSITPFILGFINLAVAVLVAIIFYRRLKTKQLFKLKLVLGVTLTLLFVGVYFAQPIVLWGEQKKYKDKVIYSEQTKYQKIVITEWKDEHWLYLNNNLQLSSIDEAMYHEPIVHSVMGMVSGNNMNVLILGGGDGCAARELLKYKSIEQIDLVDLDPRMTELANKNKVLLDLNFGALKNEKVTVYNKDAFIFLEQSKLKLYDAIIIDLPDPRSVEIGRLYSSEFYKLCFKSLKKEGAIITQAGSPYYASKAFRCIEKTMASAGFSTLPLHNQVLSLGEWGWILGTKREMKSAQIKLNFVNINLTGIETKWLNKEALTLMSSFGKDFFLNKEDPIEINKIHHPVLYNYYLKGNWEIY